MRHLTNPEIISTLVRADPVLDKIMPNTFHHMEKSKFALILDAVLEQLYRCNFVLEFREQLYDKLGVEFGPADMLVYLRPMRSRKISIVKKVCHVCKDTLNLNNSTYDQHTMNMINNLAKLQEIGKSTVKNMKLYTLVDLDILPSEPEYLQAVKKVYKLDDLNYKQMRNMSKKWAPYRSIVAWHLWRFSN